MCGLEETAKVAWGAATAQAPAFRGRTAWPGAARRRPPLAVRGGSAGVAVQDPDGADWSTPRAPGSVTGQLPAARSTPNPQSMTARVRPEASRLVPPRRRSGCRPRPRRPRRPRRPPARGPSARRDRAGRAPTHTTRALAEAAAPGGGPGGAAIPPPARRPRPPGRGGADRADVSEDPVKRGGGKRQHPGRAGHHLRQSMDLAVGHRADLAQTLGEDESGASRRSCRVDAITGRPLPRSRRTSASIAALAAWASTGVTVTRGRRSPRG
jgi:hypothetical protein